MIKKINSHSAYIVQVSRLISEPVLSKILEEPTLSRQDRILSYLYIYHFATKDQCMILCNTGKALNNAFNNTLKRLCDKDVISLCDGKEKEDVGKSTYRIKKKGMIIAEDIFHNKLKSLVEEEGEVGNFFKALCENNDVTIDECVTYLSEKCEEFITGKFSAHTLGVNDATLALLPNKEYRSPILYTREREAFCDKNGVFVSIYEKTYRNLVFKSGAVRCDALLNFYYPSDRAILEVCIEQDTGSQQPAVIKDKIEKYCTNIFQPRLSATPSLPLPMLVFSIAGSKKVSAEEKKRIAGIGDFSPRERYLAHGVELAAAMYRTIEGKDYCSLYELSAYLEDLRMPLAEKEPFLTFIDECIEKLKDDDGGRTEASELRSALYEKFKYSAHNRQAQYDNYIDGYYRSRRDVIINAIEGIAGAKELLYQGASICTISTRHAEMIRSLIPSLCGIPDAIEYAANAKILSYAPLCNLPCKGIKDGNGKDAAAVRNVYTLSNGRKIAVENIGDDYGAYIRIKRFLEANSVPCDIVCFFNRNLEGSIRKLLLKYKDREVMKKFHIITYNCVQAEEEDNSRVSMYNVTDISSMISTNTFLS